MPQWIHEQAGEEVEFKILIRPLSLNSDTRNTAFPDATHRIAYSIKEHIETPDCQRP